MIASARTSERRGSVAAVSAASTARRPTSRRASARRHLQRVRRSAGSSRRSVAAHDRRKLRQRRRCSSRRARCARRRGRAVAGGRRVPVVRGRAGRRAGAARRSSARASPRCASLPACSRSQPVRIASIDHARPAVRWRTTARLRTLRGAPDAAGQIELLREPPRLPKRVTKSGARVVCRPARIPPAYAENSHPRANHRGVTCQTPTATMSGRSSRSRASSSTPCSRASCPRSTTRSRSASRPRRRRHPWWRRCSSTSATTACARSRWTRPTAWPAGST